MAEVITAGARVADRAVADESHEPAHLRMVGLPYPVMALCAAAVALWVSALDQIDVDAIGDTGLVSVLPLRFFAALALLTVSFTISVHRDLRPRWHALHVAILVLIIHGTLPLIYDAPRFAYVYKHLGVVDLVSRYGTIDRTIDAYNNWPGFFLLNAYFREAAGLRDSIGYTPWAPVFFNLGFVMLLLFVHRSLVDDTRVRWCAVWLFVLGNWVGQDYLAPQAFAYLLYLAIVGVALAWLPSRRPWRWWGRARSRAVALAARWNARARWDALKAAYRSPEAPEAPATPERPWGGGGAAIALVLVLFTAVVASHQLSPLMITAVITALIVVGRRGPWWLPLVMAAMTVAWFWLVAGEFLSAHSYLVGDVGQRPDSAVNEELADLTSSPGQVFVALTSRVLSASLAVLAAVGLFLRWRRGRPSATVVALAAAPLPLLGAVTYGGEMLFRVYLFSLPWVAFLAAWGLVRLCWGEWALPWRSAVAPIVATAGLFGLVVALCVAAYGQEKSNHIRLGEVEASAWFYEHAPDASLMMLVNGSFPSRLEGNYGRFEVGNFLQEPRYRNHRFQPGDVARLVRILEADTLASMDARDVEEANAYVVVSKSQIAYADLYRLATPDQIASLEAILASSPLFEVVYTNEDARVYQLVRAVRE
ncbi:MAG TPA: hypothetical protein VK306_15935 [Acidimicrobiales bacterium]|nr:hypothetical protein [Acidimicrobiales bacterium]